MNVHFSQDQSCISAIEEITENRYFVFPVDRGRVSIVGGPTRKRKMRSLFSAVFQHESECQFEQGEFTENPNTIIQFHHEIRYQHPQWQLRSHGNMYVHEKQVNDCSEPPHARTVKVPCIELPLYVTLCHSGPM